MECNREEAVRAKELAEKKMENKDFGGARKIAIKAQNLYPELENISQLVMVCDVHCSAENKVCGTEMDWYGILKLEPTADDVLIKKQFRKYALFLHPDKNKFAGAADAFKLIGEAHRVLLDREKRKMHDMKCKFAAASRAPKQASRPSNVRRPPGPENSSVNAYKQYQQTPQTAQTGFFNNRPTFWTACPFCSIRFQYYRDVLNKNLNCQTCGKSFTGYEINEGVPPQNNWSQPAFPKQTGAYNQAPNMGPQSNVQNFTVKVELGGNSGIGNAWSSEVAQPAQGSKPNKKHGDVSKNCNQKRKAEKPQPRVNTSGKKRKQKYSDCSESCNSETSSESEEEVSIEIDGFYSDQLPRRSSRSKRNVSYNENINDDTETAEPAEANKCRDSSQPTKEAVEVISPKQNPPGTSRSTGLDAHLDENGEEAKRDVHRYPEVGLQNKSNETEKKSENEKPSGDAEIEPEIYEYPDPDFSDFDKNREEKCFAAGQIWAIYDTQDAMPRFYAQIRKVLCPKFKLRITWLEPDPDDKDEMKWVEEDLPVSCGNFRHGSSEISEDHPMFSHLVSWEKGSRKDTYKIYPRKGETWALFKNWDSNWSSDPDNSRKYEYEFVEVLSEYANGTAISVVYLGKVKGYVCLFCRSKQEGVDIFEIAPKELFRFSHRVPSFQMTGEESKDIPKGSFELDPACLPINLQEIDPPASEEIKIEKMHPLGSCSTFVATDSVEPIPEFHSDVSKNQAERKNQSDSCVDLSADKEDHKLESDSNGNMFGNPTEDSIGAPDSPQEAYEIPDPEFFNFDADKSLEKFEIGQVWALYSDEDGLPKYYCKIKKIDLPEHKLHIVWLGVGSTPDSMIQWTDKNMPITCGRFKLKKMKASQYTSTASFSHQVRVVREITDTKEEYVILPRKGEVWALYKNWNTGMNCSDLENCEYDMVEVVEEYDSGISVLSLEVVDGFKSVFRAQMNGQSPVTTKIPTNELLRFSHQIPAFWLTEERGGSLRGYVELDPAALPFNWFCSD